MNKKVYAGIGSRETPRNILSLMSLCGLSLFKKDYLLHSGGAIGADKAFEHLVPQSGKIIFRPNNATDEAILLASKFHQYWENCDDYARRLHGRNSQIILGEKLNSPVDFVICYTTNGKDKGGTGLGIRIAQYYDIPIFNLFYEENVKRIEKMIHESNN